MGDAAYAIRHREAGLCLTCPLPAIDDHRYCLKHYQLRLSNATKRRKNRKRRGLCGICSNPAPANRYYCEKHQQYDKERYNLKRIKKICSKCSNPVIDGHSLCGNCIPKSRKRQIVINHRLRKKCKENRICPTCFRPLEEGEGITCTMCKELRVRQKAYSVKI